jgi:ABC-2 type transport system permease protein
VLLVALTVMASITFMSLGFAIGARSSGVESASVLSGMIVLPVVFLSGAFFPISGLPDWLEPVVEMLPMAPLIEAMRAVAIDGGTLTDIGGQLLTVLAWVPVVFVIALVAMRPRKVRVKSPQVASQVIESHS